MCEKMLPIMLAVALLVRFCSAGYNEISRYRPLQDDEKDFIDPAYEEYLKSRNITPFISSGYRVLNLSLDSYVVSIRTRQPTAYFGDNHFCTGTLITNSLVLTAAHCVVDGQGIVTRPKRLRVVAGSPFRLRRDATTMVFKVAFIVSHPKFKRTVGNDIALLILDVPIPQANAEIKVLPITRTPPPVGSKCYTLGWGQLFWDGPYADHITYGNLSILPDEVCIKEFGNKFYPHLLCVANPENPYVDACRGDSGAPLICGNKLVGVVALSGMCSDLKPRSYTDVSTYYDWVYAASRGKQCITVEMQLFLIYFVFWIVK